MNTSEHAKILKTYIDRLSIKDLKNILFHHESCYQEFLNGNANSQKNADVFLYSVILNIIGQMSTTDRNGITLFIDKTLNRKG